MVGGLGDGALAVTAGLGTYTTTALIVWKGTTEFVITAYQVALPKEKALAKVILPLL
jgi:hypothetical protein